VPKIPKVVVGYLPANQVSPKGTSCDTCRDFIRSTSECTILTEPSVSGRRGTCIFYILGQPHETAPPLRLIDKAVAGYIEGKEVPTFCGRCKHYEHPDRDKSTCEGVGDSPDDLVEFGGCCNAYEARASTKKGL